LTICGLDASLIELADAIGDDTLGKAVVPAHLVERRRPLVYEGRFSPLRFGVVRGAQGWPDLRLAVHRRLKILGNENAGIVDGAPPREVRVAGQSRQPLRTAIGTPD